MKFSKNLLKGYHPDNDITLVKGGSEYFSLLGQLIASAKRSIHFQVYIFEDDDTGREVSGWLREAAIRGVQLYMIADGFASQSLSTRFISGLMASGVHFKYFEPLFRSRNFYLGRRLHHKLVVVDDEQALVGGINISNRYNDIEGQPAWLDFALHVRGTLAADLAVLGWKTWNGFARPESFYLPSQPDLNAIQNPQPVRMRRNDWVRRKNQISVSYIQMLRNAEKDVIILSSYFIPGRTIRRHISAAAKRGVRIRLILAGLSDVKIAKNAERFMYDWLLRRKIEIFEYNKSILHGKVAVCDDEWLTVGSYNINDISAYASIELNLEVRSADPARDLRTRLEQIMKNDCHKVVAEPGKRYNSSLGRQLACWLSYRIFRFTLYVFTFYFKRQG